MPGEVLAVEVFEPRIVNIIPNTTSAATAAIAIIMPRLLRAGAAVDWLIVSRAALSRLIGPPGFNSVAMFFLLWFPGSKKK